MGETSEDNERGALKRHRKHSCEGTGYESDL
jgi:hypothetical protein